MIRRHAKRRRRFRRIHGGRRFGAGHPGVEEAPLIRQTFSIGQWHLSWLAWYACHHGCLNYSEALRHLIDSESERRHAEASKDAATP